MRITLLDANDSPPVCESTLYRASLDEGAMVFDPPLIIRARDPDTVSEMNYRFVKIYLAHTHTHRNGSNALMLPTATTGKSKIDPFSLSLWQHNWWRRCFEFIQRRQKQRPVVYPGRKCTRCEPFESGERVFQRFGMFFWCATKANSTVFFACVLTTYIFAGCFFRCEKSRRPTDDSRLFAM